MRLVPFLAALLIGMVVAAPPSARADTTRPLRLMTYNLNYGNPTPTTALDAIARADVDIVLLQEVTSEWERVLSDRFAAHYPHSSSEIRASAACALG